jgi:hypothetical protein
MIISVKVKEFRSYSSFNTLLKSSGLSNFIFATFLTEHQRYILRFFIPIGTEYILQTLKSNTPQTAQKKEICLM